VGIGSELTFEVVIAAKTLQHLCPALRVRVVNVTDLMILEMGTSATHTNSHPHALSPAGFDALFTPDRAVHINYHGYPAEIQGLLFNRGPGLERITVAGYREEGTTTTPLDLLLRNGVSRFDVMEHAVRGAARVNASVARDMATVLAEVRAERDRVQVSIMATGQDPDGTFDWP
jgi:xylulose-5-phosphate/fructose-6-phosphate phosphoketolase